VCSIFANKASQNIENLDWLNKFFNVMLISVILVYLVVGFFSVKNYNECNNFFYIVTEALNCLISFIFAAIGWRIS
jgi:hypothetical protein